MAPMKRSAEDPAGQLVLVPQKKQRNEMMIVNNASRWGRADIVLRNFVLLELLLRAVMESNVPRTSNMEAPIMLLSGHSGEVQT